MRKLALLCSALSVATAVQAQTPTPAPVAPPVAPAEVSPTPATPPVEEPAAQPPSAATPSVPAVAPTVAPTAAAPVVAAPMVAAAAPESIANPTARTIRDFQNEDISMVLRLLARQAGISVVVSDSIAGTINMRVENVTPMEAIRVIAEAKGLDLTQSNNVYFLKTAAEKAKEPTETGCYTFSYAKVSEVKDLIATQVQSKIVPQIDERTNTVFFRDYRSNLANLQLFFETIDRPTRQVMIEARMVEVTANPKQSYGINWGGVVGNSSTAQTFNYGNGAVTAGSNASIGNLSYTTDGHKASGQMAILTIPQMSVTLRMLNEDSDAEFLANPRVVTASARKATIRIVRNQPVPKLKYNEQTATTEFDSFEDKTYGNTLEVTPTINKEDFISMQVKPEISNKVSDATFTISSTTVTSPVIDTRTLDSNVVIRSGDTLAIGGLLQDEGTKARSKVPGLGDIPLLGYAFQERLNSRTKRNLLVFITPTIIRQGYGTGLEDQVSGLKNTGEEYADPNGWRNNARGSVRLVPTSNRPVVADYPKPGTAPAPVKVRPISKPVYKNTAPEPTAKPKAKATPQTVAQKNSDPDFKITVPQREE
ncbi:MAG: type II secretion system protein GspD [Chthoniobacteraceae bacterium]